jgi:hypothetical protein
MHSSHPLRIFGVSGALTLVVLMLVAWKLGPHATLLALMLCIIEITFSFDNAIINARILRHMSQFWQQMFLTIGILIAVFGMRLVFPIAIVAITAQLDWKTVLDLALNHPAEYSRQLVASHSIIASFGGSFLLMLGLHFFLDKAKAVHWLSFEKQLSRRGSQWVPVVIALAVTFILAALPGHKDPMITAYAGVAGILTFLVIHGLSEVFGHNKALTSTAVKTGMAAFVSFLYLEVLDASFSFDGVIGAFAITSDVIIIAAGLGIGALWVRSLTVFMVRRKVLEQYRYLEHGAHYTILILAVILLASMFIHLPEAVPGLIGISIIGASVWSSRKEMAK